MGLRLRSKNKVVKQNEVPGAWRTRSWPDLPQNINRSNPPDFHRMDSDQFEEMTCALLAKESGVSYSDLYNVRFEKQFGIDCFGEIASGLQVASCKCYSTVKKDKIPLWSNDFLCHWNPHWRYHKIKKFILAVAAQVHSADRSREIKLEKARFAEMGVEYEVWAPRQLQEKLRGHRGIVSQYLGSEWVRTICGLEISAPLSSVPATLAVMLETRISTLSHALTGSIDERLGTAEQQLEDGLIDQAGKASEAISNGPGWPDLNSKLKARTLRLRSRIALIRGSVREAERCSNEADDLEIPDEPRLKAQIALRINGLQTGLEVLGNPSSDKGLQLKASILLAMGEIEQAESILSNLPASSENFRLLALMALYRGNPEGAIQAAGQALHMNRKNQASLRAMAMALYASALSRWIDRNYYLMPNPIAPSLLRQDDASREALQRALELFQELIGYGKSEQRLYDELWTLACFCNLPGREVDACSFARKILAQRPDEIIAIGWVLAHALDVDLNLSRVALEAKVESGNRDPDIRRALSWLNEANDDALQTPTNLSQEDDSPGHPRLRVMAIAAKTGNADELAIAFEKACSEDPHSAFILGAADILVRCRRWDVLGRQAIAVAAFGTAEAFTLACYGAANSGSLTLFFELLANSQLSFSGKRLPYELRRMEVYALVNSGRLTDAVKAAEALAGDSGAAIDFILAAKANLWMGSRSGATAAIRVAFLKGGLPPTEALQWAGALAPEDIKLARDLWKSAATKASSDPVLAAQSMVVSFGLGLEHERPEFMQSIVELAQTKQAGFAMVSLNEVIETNQGNENQAQQAFNALSRGDTPIHLATGILRSNLADVYWLPRAEERAPRAMFVYSGARTDGPLLQLRAKRVVFDVTAFLIASQLELLPVLRQSGRELLTVPSTAAALLSVEENLWHRQPRQVEAAKLVLINVGRRISISAASHFPTVGWDDGAGSFTVAQVTSALFEIGWITRPAFEAAQKVLNIEHVHGGPPARECLTIPSDILILFADAGLLDAFVDAYTVYIDVRSVEDLRDTSQREDHRAEMRAWVSEAREFLADSLRTDFIKIVDVAVRDSTLERFNDPVLENIGEMLRAATQEGCLWIDDRYANSFAFAGDLPIFGVHDVLLALREEGALDTEAYFEKVHRLRVGGALFIPFTCEEIWSALDKAPIVQSCVQETPRLRAIRRSVAMASLHLDCLRLPQDDSPGRPHEGAFLVSLRRMADQVIVKCWSADTSIEITDARATWAWRALRLESYPRRLALSPQWKPELPVALSLSSIILAALQIFDANGQSSRERRKAFLDWVERNIIGVRLENDKVLSDSVATYLGMMLQPKNLSPTGIDGDGQRLTRHLLSSVVTILPPKIISLLAKDANLLTEIGLQGQVSVQIGGKSFDAPTFWTSAAIAYNHGSSTIWTYDCKEEFQISCRSAESSLLTVKGKTATLNIVVPEGILADDQVAVRKAFTLLATQLDVPKIELSRLLQSIGPNLSNHSRMNIVDSLREHSVSYFIETIKGRLTGASNFTMELLRPPPAVDWLRYLRWPENESSSIVAMIDNLINEVGSQVGLRRIIGLPITITDHFGQLLIENQDALTFMGEIHRTRALRKHFLSAEKIASATSRIIEAYSDSAKLFLSLLKWGRANFLLQAGWLELSPVQKHALIWTYAEHTTRAILEASVNGNHLSDAISEHGVPQNIVRTLYLDQAFDGNALDTEWIQPTTLLLAGLEHALSESADLLNSNSDLVKRLIDILTPLEEDGLRQPIVARALAFAPTPFETWLSRPEPNCIFPDGTAAERVLEDTVTSLSENPTQRILWVAVAFFGRPCIRLETGQRLASIFVNLDLLKLLETDTEPFTTLRAVADISSRLAQPSQSDKMLNLLFSVAGSWFDNENWSSGEASVLDFLNVGVLAAREVGAGGATKFAHFLRAIFAKWPHAGAIARPFLERLMDQLPATDAAQLWEALLAARAS